MVSRISSRYQLLSYINSLVLNHADVSYWMNFETVACETSNLINWHRSWLTITTLSTCAWVSAASLSRICDRLSATNIHCLTPAVCSRSLYSSRAWLYRSFFLFLSWVYWYQASKHYSAHGLYQFPVWSVQVCNQQLVDEIANLALKSKAPIKQWFVTLPLQLHSLREATTPVVVEFSSQSIFTSYNCLCL